MHHSAFKVSAAAVTAFRNDAPLWAASRRLPIDCNYRDEATHLLLLINDTPDRHAEPPTPPLSTVVLKVEMPLPGHYFTAPGSFRAITTRLTPFLSSRPILPAVSTVFDTIIQLQEAFRPSHERR